MREVNIVIIGGGSHNWSPKLMADLALTHTLRGRLTLMDIDPQPLSLMVDLGRRMMDQLGGHFQIAGTDDLSQALDGADYVILTINTGGYTATRQDLEIPEKYGLVQTVGDTVGPGGLMRGLRNIPVVAEIAQEMECLCPEAWLLNYSNPMGILTRTVDVVSEISVVGLCHELLGLERKLMAILGITEKDRIKLAVGGINHFSWVCEATLDGQDIRPRILEHAASQHVAVSPEDFSPYDDQMLVKFRLLESTGLLGVAGDRHVVEFYGHFISAQSQYGWQYGVKRTTADDFEAEYAANGRLARDMLAGQAPLPAHPSGEIVFQIIEAIEQDQSREFFVNLPNVGQIANLPLDNVVETHALANAKGITPIAFGELPPSVVSQVRLHSDIQEMIVEAGLTGDRELALQAFLLDPLIRDFDAGRQMFEEMCRVQGLFV
jgi:alpha-galactosidase